MDQRFSSFRKSIFRMNRSIGNDLEYQFLVVGLLLYTIVLNALLNIFYRGVDRICENGT